MLLDYYNKMLKRGEYGIKMGLIPPVFKEEYKKLQNMTRFNGWHGKRSDFINRMEKRRNTMLDNYHQKEMAEELEKYITHVKNTLK